jgi:hypothetical protein
MNSFVYMKIILSFNRDSCGVGFMFNECAQNSNTLNSISCWLRIFYIYKSECVSVCVCVCLAVCMFKINSLTP